MSVKRIRPQGRPSAAEVAILDWGYLVAKEIETYQRDGDFVASGDSLDSYEVEITKKNQVEIRMADYVKFSVAGRGRHPGGGFPPVNDIVDWIETKGIQVPDEMTLEGFAFIIARKQFEEGNLVYRGDRPGIPVDLIIAESFDRIGNQIAFDVAVDASKQLTDHIKQYKK